MALRCGIDLIEIARVERGIDRLGERFLKRFFTARERADCGDLPHRLAARLAAKEAVAKALGTGIGAVGWRDIEIISDARGRPVLYLHGEAARQSAELAITQWEVSLTHTETTAGAVAVGV